jgi:hypothetical protein
MPLSLPPDEQSILRALSEPIADRGRRHEFLQEAERRIEEASPPSAIGPGLMHRVGRATQRDYFDPPDLRQSRVGPRG